MQPFYSQRKRVADDFNSIALSVASPEDILSWSHGEVTKPETINYRTQRPESDGLFCEKIFGPTKNWECFCGKYKRIRYKGVVCEKCGVEVTRSLVRRERMGHINLAVPVTHIWFLRSTPSRIGLLLDLPIKTIEQVVYFAAYIVTHVDSEGKKEVINQLEKEFVAYKKKILDDFNKKISDLAKKKGDSSSNQKNEDISKSKEEIVKDKIKKIEELAFNHHKAVSELNDLKKGKVLNELDFRELNMKFGHIFKGSTGAESIREIISNIDLKKLIDFLVKEKNRASGQKQKKLMKRIKLAGSLLKAGIRPEWMILTRLPVIPPDLRPMVQLDGGRFAASDLNDLYRRVINRNNRLKRLIAIGAPEVICRNEKRMLQEAVDTLFNNSTRTGRAVFTAGDRRKLRSLADMLKGKQGRFRQNLLGKRVDYSGRSVIVVGPKLRLYECGIPKEMAMRLFKPFIIGGLLRLEHAHNVKSAEKLIANGEKIVWDLLEKIIKDKYVLLNRAPTLHRLGIQAFLPVLVEGKAIQVHPLVCAAFNADFDGDQMAVHLPLSSPAQKEAKELMLASTNLLKPSAGEPVITPTQDMVLGCYFLTKMEEKKNIEKKNIKVFFGCDEAVSFYDLGIIKLQETIKARIPLSKMSKEEENNIKNDSKKTKKIEEKFRIIETTVGRIIFNSLFPDVLPFLNKTVKKKDLKMLISECLEKAGPEKTWRLADDIKAVGFKYATLSGLSISASDMVIPEEKSKIVNEANEIVRKINNQYWKGWITENERYNNAIKIWSQIKTDITGKMISNFERTKENDVFFMIDSGARGNWGQVTQLCGMKGLVANPGGKTIELPIKSNLKEGFSILEYFIATHGGRKGKSDTALKTAEAGYLTRRLVDAVQDIIIKEKDCGSKEKNKIFRHKTSGMEEEFSNRIFGKILMSDVVDSKTKKTIAKAGDFITRDLAEIIDNLDIDFIETCSIVTCNTENGICQKCYGVDLGTNTLVDLGTPIGIIAAQSIGEPGTQLTMRTFHMGGVAEGLDITQGLTRVEELFEARPPKTPAVLADFDGEAVVKKFKDRVEVLLSAKNLGEDKYNLFGGSLIPKVKKGEKVKEKQIIAKSPEGGSAIRAKINGTVSNITKEEIIIKHSQRMHKIYTFPLETTILVDNKSFVKAGTPLNPGHLNLQELMNKQDVYNVQKYLVSEVYKIYASQGQNINEKHIEIITKKMFSKVRILEQGDSSFLPGQVVDFIKVSRINNSLKKRGKKPAHFERLLLGLTRIALATESWLSAASFQETIRVLVEASTTKKIDLLRGLKENVIIGKLIPAGNIFKRQAERR